MPARSIASRQKQLLGTNFLDLTGSSKLEYGPVTLDALSDQLALFAFEFAERARHNLNLVDRTASGYLSDSIIPTRVTIFGKVYKVDIKIADYYKYVNEGVKGWADEKGGNSPYQFKQYTGRSGQKTSAMVTAIRKWLIKEGLKGTAKVNHHIKASRRDRARASITDTATATAIIISRSIRKKGLRPSHFWTMTLDEMRQRMALELGKAFKTDIINNILPTKK
jgi:hypothetical protein